MKTFIFLLPLIICKVSFSQTGWQKVTGFGTNPGALNMFSYAPATLPTNAPLIVVMHGCTQNAIQVSTQSGWNKLADNHHFYIVYPEQISANNGSNCFNWFLPADQSRDLGEPASIKQMVDYMKSHYSIDNARIFVTGLSAGACMSSVMMADYPEIFNKGALIAGVPFKAATDIFGANTATAGNVTKTAQQWGDLVRNENPSYMGAFPKVAIFHGSADNVVNVKNATELVKQWTNVNSADQTADLTINNFNGNNLVTKNSYYDAQKNEVVQTYIITNMGHAIALDTGSCYQQGGVTATYAVEVNFFSSFWAAYFFGILKAPYTINGLISVSSMQNNVIYTISGSGGSAYTWSVPNGASIISGQGSNSITVNFGTTSGYVSVIETSSSSCKIGPLDLWVTVDSPSGINVLFTNEDVNIRYDQYTNTVMIDTKNKEEQSQVKIYQLNGQELAHRKLMGTSTLTLENTLKPGCYIVEVGVSNTVHRMKILVY
ncbi:MAG: PHB depolymerase family esterase [Bacteroidetes bacterium]|nr:PHB depolymerase family esterase [Bacteroidota bacterium]